MYLRESLETERVSTNELHKALSKRENEVHVFQEEAEQLQQEINEMAKEMQIMKQEKHVIQQNNEALRSAIKLAREEVNSQQMDKIEGRSTIIMITFDLPLLCDFIRSFQ